MNTRPSPWIAALATLLLLASVVYSGPAQAGNEPLKQHPSYEQSKVLKSKLTLNAEQALQIQTVLRRRSDRERHLRRQMRTTLTPLQQQKLKALWQQRSGKKFSDQEKAKIQLRLGVTENQERQLAAYRAKIKAYQKETRELVAMRLRPDQESTFRQMAVEF